MRDSRPVIASVAAAGLPALILRLGGIHLGVGVDTALFGLGIDSKRRGSDLVKLRVRPVCHGDRVASRAIVLQQKTQRSVQFGSSVECPLSERGP